jgi:hypothetical protein
MLASRLYKTLASHRGCCCIEAEARAWELTTSGQLQKLGRVRGGNGWVIETYQRSVDILNACSS